MKLHELKPAAGSRRERTRVGRGIAAGKGKTAGRGTKGQKSRAGGSIPPWFEGGQTPIHMRVPKLRGFKRAFKVEYQVVNIGRIADYAAAGRFGVAVEAGAKKPRSGGAAPVTVNAPLLAAAGLIRADDRPIKVLGQGDVGQPLFVAADAFTAGARRKIEDAGGFVQVVGEASAGVKDEPGQPPPATPAETAQPAAAETAQPAAAETGPQEQSESTTPRRRTARGKTQD